MSIHKQRFQDALKNTILIADGAMGTQLFKYGFQGNLSLDALSITHPEIVQKIHLEYIEAGADLITTNTFGANKYRQKKFGHQHDIRKLNIKAVKIAREAREISGRDVFVCGSVGPIGAPIEPYGKISKIQTQKAFEEQISALVEGGIDVLLFETFSNLEEIEIALNVANQLSDLPIIANLTFNEETETPYANTPVEVSYLLTTHGVDVIGANCSVGPLHLLDVFHEYKSLSKTPIAIMPNAGIPVFKDGRYIYLSSPEYFAEVTKTFVKDGISIIGGCCGTTPDHIRAIANVVRTKQAPLVKLNERKPRPIKEQVQLEQKEKSKLHQKLGKKFIISAEVSPPKGINPEKVIKGAKALKDAGCDVINVADSPMARLRMDAPSMSFQIEQQVGIETITHYTSRDRNIMALQGILLGAHSLGLRNFLSVTGDPPTMGDYPNASSVYDVDAIGICKILQQFNNGTDLIGKSIGQASNFCYGVALNPVADDMEREMDRFYQKIDNGAMFAQTQPFFDIKEIDSFLKHVEKSPIPIMIGVLPLHSFRHAMFLHNEVPGIDVPIWARDRMEKAGENGVQEGISIATDLLNECLTTIDGVYLMPSFGRYEVMAEVVKNIRDKRK